MLEDKQIGDSVIVEGNIADVPLKKGTNEYNVRNRKNLGIEWIEQKLRVQLNDGKYLSCWTITPPFFETKHKGTAVKFTGQVAEYRGNRFLEACKDSAGSPAMSPPTPDTPPKPPQEEKEAVDWDAKDMRNARMNGLNNAALTLTTLAQIYSSGKDLTKEEVLMTADCFVDYIYNGLDLGTKESRAEDCAQLGQEKQEIEDNIAR